MNWEAWVTLVVVALVLYALARNLAGPDVVLMGAVAVVITMSLASGRFPGPREAIATFGNEGLLSVAVLFVVAAGLTETGALRMLTERLLGRPSSDRDALLRLMPPVAVSSAFLNNTPVVAMFIPVVNDWCKRTGLAPSKLFIPLSYAAVLGGVCTLIGTSTNLVVQGLMLEAQKTDPTMPTFGMFTLSPVGVPVALAGLAFVVLAAPRLLPARRSASARLDDPREYTVEMDVERGSAIDGLSIEAAGLRHLPGMYLAAIERGGERRVAVGPDEVLRGGDQLTFVGIVDSVRDLHRTRGLVPARDQVLKLNNRRDTRLLVEAVVSPSCPLVGKSVREGRFRSHYDAVVIAVHRNGERIDMKIGDIVLRAGDTLLLETHRYFLRQHRNSHHFFLVSDIPDSQPLRHDRAWIALAILCAMILVVSFEDFTGIGIFHGGLLAAGLMGLTGCLSAEQGRRNIEWQTLMAIAGALVLGRTVETSGLADTAASSIVGVLQPAGPVAVLAGVYLLTLIFTEVVTNNAAAALAFPLAHAAAHEMGVNFMPFAVAIAVAASAGFATPLGYQTHLMVYGVGGYKFHDYLRMGIPLDVLAMVLTVLIAPFVFPFR